MTDLPDLNSPSRTSDEQFDKFTNRKEWQPLLDKVAPNQVDTLTSILLQYRAELNQGLNELAGHDPIEQAKQAILDLIEGVIGEDEEYPTNRIRQSSVNMFRNELRTEQRQRLVNLVAKLTNKE